MQEAERGSHEAPPTRLRRSREDRSARCQAAACASGAVPVLACNQRVTQELEKGLYPVL
jgi:hypothetical protein